MTIIIPVARFNHPVLLVGSWFDAQDFWGPFRMYDAMTSNSLTNTTHFIVGPGLRAGYATPRNRCPTRPKLARLKGTCSRSKTNGLRGTMQTLW